MARHAIRLEKRKSYRAIGKNRYLRNIFVCRDLFYENEPAITLFSQRASDDEMCQDESSTETVHENPNTKEKLKRKGQFRCFTAYSSPSDI